MQLFVADARPLLGAEAIDFPAVNVDGVAGAASQPVANLFEGKVTLVTVSFQAHGKLQSDTWHAPFLNAFHMLTANPVKNVQVRAPW